MLLTSVAQAEPILKAATYPVSIEAKGSGSSLVAAPVRSYAKATSPPFHLVLQVGGPEMGSEELYYVLALVEQVLIKCGVLFVHVFSTGGGTLLLLAVVQKVHLAAHTAVALASKGNEGKQEVTSCEEPSSLCPEKPIELLGESVEGKTESCILTLSYILTFGSEVTAEG